MKVKKVKTHQSHLSEFTSEESDEQTVSAFSTLIEAQTTIGDPYTAAFVLAQLKQTSGGP